MAVCQQVLICQAATIDAVQAEMTPFKRDAKGNWQQAWPTFPVVVGNQGMAWDEETLHRLYPTSTVTRIKKEGDNRSPIGSFPLTQAFGRAPHVEIRLPYFCIEGLEGIDDSNSRYYNQLVRRQHVEDVDWTGSERMEEYPIQYNWGLFVGYNSKPAKPYAGSCIFLHVWKSFEKGTAGCTAMSDEMMRKILAWLDPVCAPRLLQCPKNVYPDLGYLEDLYIF